jgi:sporulation protein YlmC with PRC-barrel domain
MESALPSFADNMQAADELRTSKIVGTNVYNDANQKIGSVEDIVLKADGSMDGVVLSVGGFLGIGNKYVAVPFSDLKINRDGSSLKIGTSGTKESLKSLPDYQFYNSRSESMGATGSSTGTGGTTAPVTKGTNTQP